MDSSNAEITPYQEQMICALARVYPRTWKNYRAGRSRHITAERIEKALLELQLDHLIRSKSVRSESVRDERQR